jgi:predicted ABC-type ATPase
VAGPNLVILGGPNGAGKTTASKALLRDTLSVTEFVNADAIARGLSGFQPAGSAIAAGRIMLEQLRALAEKRADFAFETTMASRSFAPWLRELAASGYRIQALFLWLPSPELAIHRVRERVRAGGHDVPEETIRRRFARGIRNFQELYRPLAQSWRVYDNSSGPGPRLIASGRASGAERIFDAERWRAFQAHVRAAATDEDDRGAL